MVSMIDVVFLLLIFFLVTTTFIKPERQVATGIKVESTDSGKRQSDLEPAVIDVVEVGGQAAFRLGAITTTDLEELRKILQEFENKSDGAFVRVAPNVPFESAAQAIGICKATGFSTVSYIPVD
jgi:biopolymer transport protein ExbD